MNTVLIIDDDKTLCQLLSEFLTLEQFDVSCLHSGETVLAHLQKHPYDVVVLDVMLPGINGIDLLRKIRANSLSQPILMLTARGDDTDRIIGLELGADDYLAKPCNPKELAARLRAILRRITPIASNVTQTTYAQTPVSTRKLLPNQLSIDLDARRVWVENTEILLTATEYDLLVFLTTTPNHSFTKDHLSQQILGKPISSYDRSLDMHISNLRRKLPPAIAQALQTVRGVGYRYTQSDISQ